MRGWFAAWRWALVWATQLVFYGGAWLTWNGRQALLFDIAHRKFYLFGLVFWPQDIIYLSVLLIVSALSLFLFTAVAGRLWCGYACPQTVYTEIFLWIERRVEGDRNARMRLDKQGFTTEKVLRKSTKHGLWIALSLWTGLTFVGYFTPIRELLTSDPGPWEAFWVVFYGFATYGNAGWMREQVCKYMCPYARFQSAMFDKDTLIITYDEKRGEPRGKGAGKGDCVDCGICVQVCPTGIDIRKGLQYECIGCAACIDGCNQVMDKMGYARGLIRYSTQNALTRGYDRPTMWRRVLRPRTLAYSTVLVALTIVTVVSIALRNPLKVDIIRDRGALAREAAPGVIENVYRIQLMNTDETPRRFEIRADGFPGLTVEGIEQPVALGAAQSRMLAVRLRAPIDDAARPSDARDLKSRLHNIEFTVRSVDEPQVVRHETSTFIVPR